jgi:hypothetical protein
MEGFTSCLGDDVTVLTEGERFYLEMISVLFRAVFYSGSRVAVRQVGGWPLAGRIVIGYSWP